MFMLRLNFINKPKLTSPFKSNLNESDRLRGFSATHTHTSVFTDIYIHRQRWHSARWRRRCVCVSIVVGTDSGKGRDGQGGKHLDCSLSEARSRRPSQESCQWIHTHTHTVKFKVKEVQTESLWNGFLSVNINIDNSSMKKKEGRENAP